MPNLTMPYQRLQQTRNILFAARGSSIDLFNLEDGSHISSWTNSSAKSTEATENSSSSPPAKRRKTSEEDEVEEGSESKENCGTEGENGSTSSKKEKKKQNNRSDAVASGLESPAVIALKVTADGNHVVAVTAEDKSVRVFDIVSGANEKQELKQIALRQMPKRPCAITLTPDSKTIISADKFGDVYSLQVLPDPSTTIQSSKSETPDVNKPYQPAANELTIHSQRNLKALENQRRQPKTPIAEKAVFEGTLLLGHVSMLTDLILAKASGKEYILTADRDEHIRVSRGIPQSHVIEGFCLGHEEFITRLFIPSTRPEILVSGGGDPDLYVWNWLEGKLLDKVEFKSYIMDHLNSPLMPGYTGQKNIDDVNVVISGIFHLQIPSLFSDELQDAVLVTVEGFAGLAIFKFTPTNTLAHHFTLALHGNALDVLTNAPSSSSNNKRFIVSIDTVHEPNSTTRLRSASPEQPGSESESVSAFQVFDFVNGILVEVEEFEFESVTGVEQRAEEGKLANLLYGLESLRKRDGEEKDD